MKNIFIALLFSNLLYGCASSNYKDSQFMSGFVTGMATKSAQCIGVAFTDQMYESLSNYDDVKRE